MGGCKSGAHARRGVSEWAARARARHKPRDIRAAAPSPQFRGEIPLPTRRRVGKMWPVREGWSVPGGTGAWGGGSRAHARGEASQGKKRNEGRASRDVTVRVIFFLILRGPLHLGHAKLLPASSHSSVGTGRRGEGGGGSGGGTGRRGAGALPFTQTHTGRDERGGGGGGGQPLPPSPSPPAPPRQSRPLLSLPRARARAHTPLFCLLRILHPFLFIDTLCVCLPGGAQLPSRPGLVPGETQSHTGGRRARTGARLLARRPL